MSVELQPRCHGGPGFAFDGARREHRFQAAAIAAGAGGAVGFDGHVAQVAGNSGMAAQHLSVGQNGAAHAHSQSQHKGVLQAARRAPDHLARQRYAGRIIGEYRHVGGHSYQVGQAEALQEMPSVPGRISTCVLSGLMMPLHPTPTPAGCAVASSSQ